MKEKTEAAFLKQARRGHLVWQRQYRMAFAVTCALAGATAWTLWSVWQTGETLDGMFQILMWLALAAASSIWTIHAQLMQGAALVVARQERP